MDNNEFQKLVLEQLKSLDTRLTKLDSKFDVMEVRQNEIYEIVKAIEHSNQVGKAELDRHEFKISKIEGKLKKTGKVLADDTDEDSAAVV